jgi:hypothetical protein
LSDAYNFINIGRWREYIDTNEKEEEVKRIEGHLISGRPYGAERFIKKLENKLSRRIIALPRGRPITRNK